MNDGRRLVLVLGGARGGKSDFAAELAAERSHNVIFVATAEAGDAAMRRRIAAHRACRPPHWRTVEAPRNVAQAIAQQARAGEAVLLDCLTLLTANVMGQVNSDDPQEDGSYEEMRQRLNGELDALMAWYEAHTSDLIVVSNEVGMGLVPANPLGRAYRDLLGWGNSWLAKKADEVYLMVAGLPVEVKRLARPSNRADADGS